ncbi:ATP-binding cassette sub-family A member 2-like [Copidosoma floridanum]|uniref:ATP-binding cassette sub-family A member 2-like n=1 Tax=Copidosoma floridanum TaxID=29053 RepID=UPI0006C994D5|nr:ATP-binding cassette sub-family A member 2-like [Copidosoma floridanum]XP_014205586.1 ATP-binding cassette sub-family A member 2-like [Copidosoma floridanum]XP_014205587.1 ATP-binding cassette sub-family A member 2-like [Copidosoma floridanum]
MATTLKKLRLLLYKNYLVRRRQWISAIVLQILIPCWIFYSLKAMRTIQQIAPGETVQNKSYNPVTEEQLKEPNRLINLFVVPDNTFVDSLIDSVKECLGMQKESNVTKFATERDMLDAYKNMPVNFEEIYKAIVFNENTNSLTKRWKYKIYSDESLPSAAYEGYFNHMFTFDKQIGLQMCLDTTFINFNNTEKLNMEFSMRKMVKPGEAEQGGDLVVYLGIAVAFSASIVFFIQLCFETSKASEEKFLGVNVLMAMNGVPNYLNLLSWLLSGLIFSLLYTVPIVILSNIWFEGKTPLLYDGNSFIFWLILTLHAAHLFTYGMHISAYFTRSKFLTIGLLVLYVISSIYSEAYLQAHSLVPYLGIIFPNILLIRAFREISYYQIASGIGIRWSNLFVVDDVAYGTAGSLGVIMIFSIIGAIFHFVLANYVCAVNPGKYGAKKHPLYFLEFFERSNNPNDYGKVDNFESDVKADEPFETVPSGAFTPGIQLRNLRKTYNVGLCGDAQVHALKGISIDFYQGQITSLLGHNGAGKTTMMSILTGMNSPTQGTVIINGKNIENNMDEVLNEMGLCPQENIVFPNLTVYEQFKLFARLKNKNSPNTVIEHNIELLLQKLKLHEKRNVMPQKLSGGQKRRVCLGMALAGDPSILILDEPTSGLDPEVRRSIWDILLKTRGQKTILISTHDMEEADILGDRIAIVHGGRLRSYGTSMFLKKHLGGGNVEITLSTEPWCNPESIRTYLGSRSKILNSDGNKNVISVPYTPELPDALDRTESNKRHLGITGMSVSLITLEQVFLRIAKDNEDEVDDREPLICASQKLKGLQHSLHAAKGLLYKKATYTWKNATTFTLMLALILLAMFINHMIFSFKFPVNSTPMDVRLDIYDNPKIFYSNKNAEIVKSYKTTVEHYGGEAVEVPETGNLTQELLDYGYQNRRVYKTRMISSVDFGNPGKAEAIYNDEIASFAKPISMNLLTNSILRALKGPEYSIEMSAQALPHKENDIDDITKKGMVDNVVTYAVPTILAIFLFLAVALLVIHPLLENSTNIKHLQKMTGLSAFNYWGTMLLFDLAVMVFLSLVIIIGFIVIDRVVGLQMMKAKEILIFGAIICLFSLSVLPCIYCFTFWLSTVSTAMKTLTLIPVGLVILEGVMMILVYLFPEAHTLKIIRQIEKIAVLLTPYIGFFHAEISFFQTARANVLCPQLSLVFDAKKLCSLPLYSECCEMGCSNGRCENPRSFFNGFKDDFSLEGGLVSLGATFVLYSVLLWVLEGKLIQKLVARILGDAPPPDDDADEQVKKVKRDLSDEIDHLKTKSSQVIANGCSINSLENGVVQDRHIFLVYGLRKKYGRLVAVKDVNFSVRQGECFGLLGVNGAGKSTTFRMMTGEEIPHSGMMFLSDRKLTGTQNLSQMGYCPQNDAIVRSLNTYDHLRLFARLRGIPEHEVIKETKKWIRRLNLRACARNPSGTYSGGNKRRLNIAISMIGLPELVLLDEPTTGVDPAARRSLWNVIKSAQATTGQAVILTSHSMEECEALCGRLAIMVDGKLVCIGPSEELKQRFGAGYDIQIKLNPEKAVAQVEQIKRDVEALLQCQLVDDNSGYLMYHVSSTATKWRKMYDAMRAVKHKYDSIEDFCVLSSTLEQLFLLFARAANKSH